MNVKEDGDVLGGHLVPRTPGDDTEWREVGAWRCSGRVPGIKDTKRWFETEGGAVHVKEHGGRLVSKAPRDSLR